MIRTLCKAKIHRATVTQSDLHYMGSITIDAALLEASGILPYEQVTVTNLANGAWWVTYVIPGPRGHGDICLNGPPARHFHPGDLVIIMSYGGFSEAELADFRPVVVFVDERNQVREVRRDEAPFEG
ncbi:MAG: aspartate 1-decarboxylase [Firmicutes bacterium]|nr:aspartate 1-decarboxylase [Alicyclobacillaceae bacterium]MCL6497480.1 aspartate 1-decarboxylase [Bacillota bacterium]